MKRTLKRLLFPIIVIVLSILVRWGYAVELPKGLQWESSELQKKHSSEFSEIDILINRLIENRNIPGAVVVIGRKNQISLFKAYGNRQVFPDCEVMTPDTLFDLASITKVAATGLCLNILFDRKKIELDAPIVRYLPELNSYGKEKILVRDLLLHVSGIEDRYKVTGTEEEIWKNICNTRMKNQPGEKYEYSCLSYIILGKLIERVSGETLPNFARKNIYDPLGMKDTGFTPNFEQRKRTAPTEQREGRWLRGEVNDFRSYFMGGRVGNAGLFSTGGDLALLASVLLNHGVYTDDSTDGGTDNGTDCQGKEQSLFCEDTFQKMTASYAVPNGYRGLSWDKKTGKPNLPPDFFPTTIGHGGYTGTSFLVDPERNMFVIILTSRLHLNPKNPNIYPTAGAIAKIAAKMYEKDRTLLP